MRGRGRAARYVEQSTPPTVLTIGDAEIVGSEFRPAGLWLPLLLLSGDKAGRPDRRVVIYRGFCLSSPSQRPLQRDGALRGMFYLSAGHTVTFRASSSHSRIGTGIPPAPDGARTQLRQYFPFDGKNSPENGCHETRPGTGGLYGD